MNPDQLSRIQESSIADPSQPRIGEGAIVRDSRLGDWTSIGAMCSVEESIFGAYSYMDRHSSLIYCDVGRFVSIAAMVRMNPGFHPMERPAMHHFTYRSKQYGFSEKDDEEFFQWRRRQKVVIGHDAWIGHGVVIMPGVRIGNGAVIGSNSVVTKDIPAYAVAVGAPARVVRYRFARDICAALERIQWWNWTHEQIRLRFADFRDLRQFLALYDHIPEATA